MRFKQALILILSALTLLALAWPAGAEIRLAPDRACKLLRGWNFKTSPYAQHREWFVCEAVKTVTNGKLPNTLSYQVVGSNDQAQELRLELSIDNPAQQGGAKTLMTQAALHLARNLGGSGPPDGLDEAIRRESEGSWTVGQAIITLRKYPMPDPPRAYRLILTVR